MFQTKVIEEIETPILCPINVFQNFAIYEIMWKNIIEPDMPQVAM